MSALFVAGWNIVSLVVEYVLLSNVYHMVPELAIKGCKYCTRIASINHMNFNSIFDATY